MCVYVLMTRMTETATLTNNESRLATTKPNLVEADKKNKGEKSTRIRMRKADRERGVESLNRKKKE